MPNLDKTVDATVRKHGAMSGLCDPLPLTVSISTGEPYQRLLMTSSWMTEETIMFVRPLSIDVTHQPLLQVRSSAELAYLVHESEIETGDAGRKFVIRGAERLAYRVWRLGCGFEVQRLDDADRPMCTLYLTPAQFDAHCLGEALRAGQLFAEPVEN